MLTVRKLSLGQASTYYSKDNYYTAEQGEFHGKLKDELGLQNLTHESFIQLLNGINPSTGESLIASKSKKEGVVPAFDFTYSPPKSVSICYEAAIAKGDTALADVMQRAHDNAVNSALNHIEQEHIKARVQKNGKRVSQNTGVMIAAKFQHDINRDLSPQLHTHSVIFNLSKCDDGKYRGLDASHLLTKGSPIILNLGQFYRESLRQELQSAGIVLRDTDKSKSFFEVAAVDDKLIEAFSTRNIAIKAKVEELKKQFPEMSKSQLSLRAFFNTRVSKKEVDRDEVRLKNIELMSKYTDIDKLLSSLQPTLKNEVQKEPIHLPSEAELIGLINLVKQEIPKKRHRTALNIATKVAAKVENVSIATIYKHTKYEEEKQQKEFKTMHEVLLHNLTSTKLNTEKLFASLSTTTKIQMEEALENGRKTNNRDRLIDRFGSITDAVGRTKQSHYRDAGGIATTAERGITGAQLERFDATDVRTARDDYPVVVTREDLQRAEELHRAKYGQNTKKGEIEL